MIPNVTFHDLINKHIFEILIHFFSQLCISYLYQYINYSTYFFKGWNLKDTWKSEKMHHSNLKNVQENFSSFSMQLSSVKFTGAKLFSCPYCNKSYPYKSYLSRHIRTHTGERPFVCKFCNMSFAHQPNLKQHQLTVCNSKSKNI